MHYFPNVEHTRTLGTEALRKHFLLTDLFQPGNIVLRPIDLDRAVLGGAVPTSSPLRLDAPSELRAEYFTERRELGILNIGGSGTASVDGQKHRLRARDVLYVGRGRREVVFSSDIVSTPARYYLVSYPAHATYPTTLVRPEDAQGNELGSVERANRR